MGIPNTKWCSSQVYKKIKEFESRLTEGLGVCLTTTGTTARQGSSNSSQQSDRLRYHPPHHHSHLTSNGLRSQASTKLKARHHQPQTQHPNSSSGKWEFAKFRPHQSQKAWKLENRECNKIGSWSSNNYVTFCENMIFVNLNFYSVVRSLEKKIALKTVFFSF